MTKFLDILGRYEAAELGQPALDLVGTLDDAASAIHSTIPEEEGTASTFQRRTRCFRGTVRR